MEHNEEHYWSKRYHEGKTGWDIGYISTPIKEYIDQLDDKDISILIPGAGNSYEAEYLHNKGFVDISILDVSPFPLDTFKNRVPSFPKEHMIQSNFFEHIGSYDLIIEQTFFCSFEPSHENRSNYALKMAELLKSGGKLVGLWFDIPLLHSQSRPFGGNIQEYTSYLSPYFAIKTFQPCHNSIPPRMGRELFGIFVRK